MVSNNLIAKVRVGEKPGHSNYIFYAPVHVPNESDTLGLEIYPVHMSTWNPQCDNKVVLRLQLANHHAPSTRAGRLLQRLFVARSISSMNSVPQRAPCNGASIWDTELFRTLSMEKLPRSEQWAADRKP
jgi:hypothetical protein